MKREKRGSVIAVSGCDGGRRGYTAFEPKSRVVQKVLTVVRTSNTRSLAGVGKVGSERKDVKRDC